MTFFYISFFENYLKINAKNSSGKNSNIKHLSKKIQRTNQNFGKFTRKSLKSLKFKANAKAKWNFFLAFFYY